MRVGGGETAGEEPRDMDGVAPCPILDLMPAGGPVGNDDGLRTGLADGRQQRQFRHCLGDFDRLGLIAEGARHAAAA